MDDLKVFLEKRNAILRSLSVEDYMAFMRKNSPRIARQKLVDPSVPLGAMHKARLHIKDFTEEEKAASRQWLEEHGYSTNIMGGSFG